MSTAAVIPTGLPSAPVNAAGDGTVSPPTAPANTAGSGTVSAPTAAVNAAGVGSVSPPTAPTNTAGSGAVSAPSGPAVVVELMSEPVPPRLRVSSPLIPERLLPYYFPALDAWSTDSDPQAADLEQIYPAVILVKRSYGPFGEPEGWKVLAGSLAYFGPDLVASPELVTSWYRNALPAELSIQLIPGAAGSGTVTAPDAPTNAAGVGTVSAPGAPVSAVPPAETLRTMLVTYLGVTRTYVPTGTFNGRPMWQFPNVAGTHLRWTGFQWEATIIAGGSAPLFFFTTPTRVSNGETPPDGSDPSSVTNFMAGSDPVTITQGSQHLAAPTPVQP